MSPVTIRCIMCPLMNGPGCFIDAKLVARGRFAEGVGVVGGFGDPSMCYAPSGA
jgi:hypothetical protein